MFKNRFIKQLASSTLDLLPILAVVVIFQVFVIRQPIADATQLIVGLLAVVLGLALFIQGLEQSLFPIGEAMAYAFARKGSLAWLLAFAFCLGFGAALAEPALAAIANEAASLAGKGHIIAGTRAAGEQYALKLRIAVAVSVGLALMIGVIRIIKGWPLHYLMLAGYCCVTAITPFAPADIIGIAFDAGGITTSTITVPLVTALGVGLATAIKGRNPVADGFGLVAFAAQMPIIFVLFYGMCRSWLL